MARRHPASPEPADDEDRPLYRARILDDGMFLVGEFAGDSLEDVWDEEAEYVLRLLKDDDLHPEDREEISRLVGEEEE